ncbi:MAG: DUF924 domain-containing protein [Rhodobacteraceae bacterium]|nr:DUF924 domain-containing protein [Paracoccaceae bacterium]
MSDQVVNPVDVLDFWWQAGPSKWFASSDDFDAQIAERFLPSIEAAKEGRLDDWSETPHGALALIILLDQFTRNVYRGSARAFDADPLARSHADKAVNQGFDKAFPIDSRAFFYLPFEHAEDIALQERSVDLFRVLGNREFYTYALEHMDVIRRFGRFPHRNKVMDRKSTDEEIRFLENGGFSA